MTQNEQLLLNLVRLRYRDPPSFLELSSLASQFSFAESVGLSGSIIERSTTPNVLGLSGGFDASDRPTASYTPLQGSEFVTKLISPIEEETIILLSRSGWKGERIFRLAVQSLNGLSNMRRASGPTPHALTQQEINDARLFRTLVQNLEEYSNRRIVRFNYETIDVPKSTAIPKSSLTATDAVQAAQQGLKIIEQHTEVAIAIDKIKSAAPIVDEYIDPELLGNIVAQIRTDGLARPLPVKYDPAETSPGVELAAAPFTVVNDDLQFRALQLIHSTEPGQYGFVNCDIVQSDEVFVAGTSQKLVMTWDAEFNEEVESLNIPDLTAADEGRYVMQIEPRSLMGAMFFLSHAICVPAEHLKSGLVVSTEDEIGSHFRWSELTGDLMCINSSKKKPKCAAVAVKYRGHWFYIDDRDHSTKATFALLMQLFELRAGGGAGAAPVLTLPVGL